MANVAEYFGSLVFDDKTMKERLDPKIYKQLRKTIDDGEQLNIQVANAVAAALKEWAVEKGATHYTHWFQPLTGITAEKHDSFSPRSPRAVCARPLKQEAIPRGTPPPTLSSRARPFVSPPRSLLTALTRWIKRPLCCALCRR